MPSLDRTELSPKHGRCQALTAQNYRLYTATAMSSGAPKPPSSRRRAGDDKRTNTARSRAVTARQADDTARSRAVTARQADDIAQRLYSATTKSVANTPCKYSAIEARDVVGAKVSSESEVSAITDRLASTHTKAWTGETCKSAPVVATPREPEMTKTYEIDDLVERLVTTETRAWSGLPCRAKPVVADNSVSRAPVSDDEKTAMLHRLNQTPTKSSAGEACKSYEPPPPPGLGLKCLPDIAGLAQRFKGAPAPQAKVNDIFSRLSSASTRSSRARYEHAKILLYPERTLLCNNVERIVSYQNTGSVVKQEALARREKWFN